MNEQDNEQTRLLREILKVNSEIVKWERFSGMKQVKEVLASTLNTDKKIIAYHHSDGKNTSTVISKLSGIPQPTISDLWKEWLSLGLGEAMIASGGSRFKRSFDLKIFGKVPEVKQETTSNTQNNLELANHGESSNEQA